MKTEYKVVTGYKEEFECQLTKLTEDDWLLCGNLTTAMNSMGPYFAQLIRKHS